jgi:hypothetical protein
MAIDDKCETTCRRNVSALNISGLRFLDLKSRFLDQGLSTTAVLLNRASISINWVIASSASLVPDSKYDKEENTHGRDSFCNI